MPGRTQVADQLRLSVEGRFSNPSIHSSGKYRCPTCQSRRHVPAFLCLLRAGLIAFNVPPDWEVTTVLSDTLTLPPYSVGLFVLRRGLAVGVPVAKFHVSNLLSKLGVTSRTEARGAGLTERPGTGGASLVWLPHHPRTLLAGKVRCILTVRPTFDSCLQLCPVI